MVLGLTNVHRSHAFRIRSGANPVFRRYPDKPVGKDNPVDYEVVTRGSGDYGDLWIAHVGPPR